MASNNVALSAARAIVHVHFSGTCPTHADLNKNTCKLNFYCIDCGPTTHEPMCAQCLPDHAAACNGSAVIRVSAGGACSGATA